MNQIELFIEKAQTEAELAAKLEEMRVNDAGTDEFIALAAEYGFTLTKEDIEQPPDASSELCMDELEIVAGGDRGGARQTCFFIQGKHNGRERDSYGWYCKNRNRCHYFTEMCKCYGTTNCKAGQHFRKIVCN